MINKENHHFYREALNHTNVGLIITDPSLPNHPIIFVNNAFVKMSGYNEEELVGQNSRILQGKYTDPKVIHEIKNAIKDERSTTVEIYNYTKDGQPFWNEVTIDPMWIDGKLYYAGVQKDITELKEKEELLSKTLEEMTKLAAPIVPIDDHISALPIIGTEVVVTGVRPDIALSTKDLGEPLKGLHTYLTIQEAIKALT